MKSRNKFTVSNFSKHSLSKKQIPSNPSAFQKKLSFLENYSLAFRKRFSYSGDVESYFKSSLRNSSDDFELINQLKSPKFVRLVKSSETLSQKYHLDYRPVRALTTNEPHINSLSDEEDPKQEFYAPISVEAENQFTSEENHRESNLEAIRESEFEGKMMAEEEFEEDFEGEDYQEELEGSLPEIQETEDDAISKTEDNEELVKSIRGEDEETKSTKPAAEPNLKDAALIQELEEAEKQAKQTRDIIYNLKNYITLLLKKDKLTEQEAKELEEKNVELKTQMGLFEEKTKRIQYLIEQTNFLEGITPPKPPKKYKEDCLPKVIVCGMAGSFDVPRLILTEKPEERKRCGRPRSASPERPQTEKIRCRPGSKEVENLQGKRQQLQANLYCGKQAVNSMQQQIDGLQNQLAMLCKENCFLQQKLQQSQQPPCMQPPPCSPPPPAPCGRGRGVCPADLEAQMKEFSSTTQQLEQQLCAMECDVKEMHKELLAVQKERKHLEHHRKMMAMPPPCSAPPCLPPPCQRPPSPHVCSAPQPDCAPDCRLKEMREQYNRLQDDFKSKLVEVAGLRAENEKLKSIAAKKEEAVKNCEAKVRELEKEIKAMKNKTDDKGFTKEQFIELVQQLNVAKQRFRESQDELDELRALILDQQNQLTDYKNKYLEAQQTVEEQRRQIDMMDLESGRITEQVNLEIQRVKNQFQEKLQELEPLPDILKSTQIKLQEAQQMHLLAERNNESLAKELQTYKDRVNEMLLELERHQNEQNDGAGTVAELQRLFDECQIKCEDLEDEIKRLEGECDKLQEQANENERIADSRLHQITQLQAQMENVREESARQVARIKDRCETVRRALQNDINDLERQLAQSRAAAKGAQKDRDEIRQKMQAQISNLNENFEDAQMRIRNLQAHVNFLNTSAGNVFGYPEPNPKGKVSENPCDCGTK